MIAIVHLTREAAEAARDAIDALHGVPAQHEEGLGPGGYTISRIGRAAERLRARGVRTDHQVQVIAHPHGTGFAIPAERGTASAVELDESWRPTPPER